MMLDKLLLNIIPVTILFSFGIANTYEEKTVYTQALLTISYAKNGEKKLKPQATYVDKSPKKGVNGYVFYAGKDVDWCDSLPPSVVSHVPQINHWIALIPRGGDNCTCREKLDVAKKNNASAAIIINHQLYDCDETHSLKSQDIVSVLINSNEGEKLIRLYRSEDPNTLYCEITLGKKYIEKQFRVSKTSVLFVLVSFILLMCISLAWLVFYYVQRFRHIYRNDRKEKQLLSAAKKAISKLKTISFQSANKDGEEDSCAVCLENYKDGENVRILPCKHLFHKCCIDPWLLNHRTCPMCKSNILKSLGVEIPDNIDLSQYDLESRRISRDVETVQSSLSPSAPPVAETVGEESTDPGTSVYTAPGSSSQAWSEPNVGTASCCSSTSSMLSDTDSERSTVALVSIVQKV